MKVLHLISSGGMYGAEAVILQLCREMETTPAHKGVLGVFALSGQPSPALYDVALDAGLEAERILCKGQLDLTVRPKLQVLARRADAELIHAHGYKADVYAAMAFRGRAGRALVSTCHTWYDNDLAVRLYGALDRRVLRSFDQVVAVSEEVRRRLLRSGVQRSRVQLIRNGVSVPPEAADLSAERGALRVGLVGRLAREKGVDVFLRAVSLLAAKHPSASFLVAGEGPDRPALQALLRELGLTTRVSLAGQQTDMPAFYRSLDLLVSASRQEGLPMAMLEGMAAGLPVVATAVGEVPQVVAAEQTGLLVPPDAPEALSVAMDRLLLDRDLRLGFGEAGRRRVVEHFSAKRMTTDYLEVYAAAMRARCAPESRAALAGESR